MLESVKDIEQLKADKVTLIKKIAEADEAISKMSQATKDMQLKVDKAVVELTDLVTSSVSSLSVPSTSMESS